MRCAKADLALVPVMNAFGKGEHGAEWPKLARIAERLLCQFELSALGPVAERQVLARKGQIRVSAISLLPQGISWLELGTRAIHRHRSSAALNQIEDEVSGASAEQRPGIRKERSWVLIDDLLVYFEAKIRLVIAALAKLGEAIR